MCKRSLVIIQWPSSVERVVYMQDIFTCRARNLERTFQRFIKKRNAFFTVMGKVNKVVSYDRNSITFYTEKSGKELVINRLKLRECIRDVFFKRIVTRKDMQTHSVYSSALLGIIVKIFESIARVQILSNGLIRLILHGVRYFFSGVVRAPEDLKLVAEEGGKFVLVSYFHICQMSKSAWKDLLMRCKEFDIYILIDSGAYSFFEEGRKAKEKRLEQLTLFEIDHLESYADFIIQHKNNERIVGFFNFDVIHNPTATRKNFKRLKELTGVELIPVWQINDTMKELEKLVEEQHKLIGLGGTVPLLQRGQKEKVRKIFEKVYVLFPEQCFHWLGGAIGDWLLTMPFTSADSTAWLNPRKNGERKVYSPEGTRVLAPEGESALAIMKRNIRFLAGLEEVQPQQLSLMI